MQMPKHNKYQKISGEWERCNFLVSSKGHLPHQRCEEAHILPCPPLKEVNTLINVNNRFLLQSIHMLSYCVQLTKMLTSEVCGFDQELAFHLLEVSFPIKLF